MIDDIVIVDSEDETLAPAGRKLTSDTLAKIDEILYADIGKLQKMDKVDKVRIFAFLCPCAVMNYKDPYYRSVVASCLRWTKF